VTCRLATDSLGSRRVGLDFSKIGVSAAAELKQAVDAIDSKVKTFRQIGMMEESGSIIERVELKRDGIQITLNLGAMLPTVFNSRVAEANLRMTRLVPNADETTRRRETHGDPRRSESQFPRADLPLLRALARGYRWFDDLASAELYQPNRSRLEKV